MGFSPLQGQALFWPKALTSVSEMGGPLMRALSDNLTQVLGSSGLCLNSREDRKGSSSAHKDNDGTVHAEGVHLPS